MHAPFIVGLGGTTRPGSTSETALRHAIAAAGSLGARTRIFAGSDLELPLYSPDLPYRDASATALITALREADGVIIASPGYHGSISGLVKNALDYVEDLRTDVRPYLHGRAFGIIVCAYGWQATGSTLSALRSVAHALRSWPTPFGAAINSAQTPFKDGECVDPTVTAHLELVGQQVYELANAWKTMGRAA
ncbi:NAD(P)H-dependent oxidoreductase [Bradyrhizobium commune]|uniref:NAD(P)H-dependent oxidoreductase n=2 Tax=Bradyrhizobium commune TaxID=83627 RepID=A0A7S9D3V2_9BRAD|nr:NADPH-dependent FMN reductase [Bradyrhizobium commune]QPF90707.1 NAD(P)H-dependent oxidoreductase [Bradyrhizobium commune]